MHPLIQTSQDVLFLVIAVCVFFITIFLTWFLFYLVKIIRDVAKLVDNAQEKIDKIGKVIDLTKEKIDHSAGHFVLMVEGAKELIKFFAQRQSKKDQKREKTK